MKSSDSTFKASGPFLKILTIYVRQQTSPPSVDDNDDDDDDDDDDDYDDDDDARESLYLKEAYFAMGDNFEVSESYNTQCFLIMIRNQIGNMLIVQIFRCLQKLSGV